MASDSPAQVFENHSKHSRAHDDITDMTMTRSEPINGNRNKKLAERTLTNPNPRFRGPFAPVSLVLDH